MLSASTNKYETGGKTERENENNLRKGSLVEHCPSRTLSLIQQHMYWQWSLKLTTTTASLP